MSIAIMLVLISLLIIVHEFGHYISAKMFGVRVKKFAIGLPFGPTLYRKKFGETEFLIHLFLFGGYVSFLDDEENEDKEKKEEKEEKEEDEEDVPCDSPLRFKNKTPLQKAIVYVAGVFANGLFALFLVILTASIYHKLPSDNFEVFASGIDIEGNTSNIVNSGIKKGDKIVKINGIDVVNPNQFIFVIQKSAFYDGYVSDDIVQKKLDELYELNKNIIQNTPYINQGVIKLPKQTPEKPLQVSSDVSKGWEKYQTGEIKLDKDLIELRDKLKGKSEFKIDKKHYYTWDMLAKALADSYKPLTITVLRGDKEIVFDNIYTNKEGILGLRIDVKDIYYQTKTPFQIIKSSVKYCIDSTILMSFGLWQIITGKINLSELHGIVVIAKVGGDIIENTGILNGLLLTAKISLNLMIMNILPIPALDGGHLIILFLETVSRRKFREETIEKINTICFFTLIVLMVLVLFNDIVALVLKKF